MRRFFRDNGLSLVLFGLFATSLIGQSIAGFQTYNEDQRDHQQSEVGYLEYVKGGAFGESVFENWESEFLQDWAYVLLTIFLFQRGSAESKDPDQDEAVDADPSEAKNDPNAPGPVRRGGLMLWLYAHSLSLVLLLLFIASFVLHAVTGAADYSEEQVLHGGQAVSALEYMITSRFWFESLQNWQSEFLAVLSLVVLSIFLREKGSPESKPVAAPHAETGSA